MLDLDSWSLPALIAALVGVVSIMGSFIIYLNRQQNKEENEEVDVVMDEVVESVTTNEVQKKNKHQRKNDQWKPKGKDSSFSHPWYVTTLKGHTNDVVDIDFATDGKKFVSVSNDRSVILWDVRDFEEREHKCLRQTLEYDTPTHVAFAPDCKSVIFSIKRENAICVYKLVKKTEGSASHQFVHVNQIKFENDHQLDISSIGIAGNAKYLMSASNDNKIFLYDLRGSVLKSIDAKVSSLYDCRLSPDGKYLIASGFTPDVFVFEPTFSRDGSFQDAKKVFNLSGHQSGVLGTAFNSTSTRAVTVSRDGYWRIFDIDIRYNAGQDAKLLRKGNWAPLHGSSSDNIRLAFSPTGDAFAVSHKADLKVFSSEDENVEYPEISDLHSTNITSISFSSDGKYIATCGDKFIRIIRNVPEWHSRIVKLTRELPDTTHDGARRRMKEQIAEAVLFLEQYSA